MPSLRPLGALGDAEELAGACPPRRRPGGSDELTGGVGDEPVVAAATAGGEAEAAQPPQRLVDLDASAHGVPLPAAAGVDLTPITVTSILGGSFLSLGGGGRDKEAGRAPALAGLTFVSGCWFALFACLDELVEFVGVIPGKGGVGELNGRKKTARGPSGYRVGVNAKSLCDFASRH
jgi:hypothetical protein